jgi:uncharacterized protein
MLRIILIALAVYCVLRLLQRYRASFERRSSATPAQESLDMVQCAHCGVHLPVNESYLIHGQYFCTTEHAKLWQNQQRN